MSETPVLKQKTVGLMLIIFGLLLAMFLGFLFYMQSTRIAGFAGILPEDKTAAFAEFPAAALEGKFLQDFNNLLKIDWHKDITPFTDRAGLAFLESPKGKLFPFLLLEIKHTKEAETQAKNFAQKNLQKNTASTFFSNFLAITTAKENFETLINTDITARHLGSSKNFIRVRRNLPGAIFAYINPDMLTPEALAFISQQVPYMPQISFSFQSIGAQFEKRDNGLFGRSFALLKNNIALGLDEAYRAKLLPFFPENPDFFLGGRNPANQIQKIDALMKEEKNLPKLQFLAELFSKEYLPQTMLEKDIWPLLQSEFGLAITTQNALFISEIPLPEITAPQIVRLRASFIAAAPKLSPGERKIILADGTPAKELVPDASQIRTVTEKFEGVEIHEIFMGSSGIFDTLVQNKWIISNDLPTLQKTILLTKEPGPNLRESALYRDMLRPIMKNPELLGISKLPTNTFGFSKRMGSDYIETDFVLR